MTNRDDRLEQALQEIGEHVRDDPEAVWDAVLTYGSREEPEMRSAAATLLLERLLACNFDRYFRRLAEEVDRGNRNLTDTLRRCWMFGGVKRHSREVDRLLRSVATKSK